MPLRTYKVSYKKYKCRNCGHEMDVQTNHYGECFNHCPKCSWKATWGEHPGVQMGTWHRPFDCLEQEPIIHYAMSFDKAAICGVHTKGEFDKPLEDVQYSSDKDKVSCPECRKAMAICYLIEDSEV